MEREEKKKKVNATKRFDEIRLYLNPRYLLGLILILASFSSAYLISKSSDRMITVWGANVDLAPGEMIEADDLKVIRVRLPDNAAARKLSLQPASDAGRNPLLLPFLLRSNFLTLAEKSAGTGFPEVTTFPFFST